MDAFSHSIIEQNRIAVDGLIAVLPRLSALNSFVRSRRGGGLHRIVYHYKREALIAATQLGIVTHAGCTVATTCHDCGGTGRYIDSCGYTHGHCWRCNSGGKVTLAFVESTFTDGTVWFSPREKSWSFCRSDAELPPAKSAPLLRQPGNELSPEEVADHLCEVESFFPKRPDPYYDRDGHCWDVYGNYRLYVGDADDACRLCAGPVDAEHSGRYVLTTGRLEWTAVVCASCRAPYPASSGAIFDVLKPKIPDTFLTPAVRRWVGTHPEKRSAQ